MAGLVSEPGHRSRQNSVPERRSHWRGDAVTADIDAGRLDGATFPPAATGTREAHRAAARLLESIEGESDQIDQIREQLEIIASGNRSDFENFFEPLLYGTTALCYWEYYTAFLLRFV